MSLPNSFLRLWAARLASKIALCGAMTYDLYQLSKARGKDSGKLRLGISDESRRQLAKSAKTEEKRTVEDVFIESLVAAGSSRHHSTVRPLGLVASHPRATRRRSCNGSHIWDQRRCMSTIPKRRQAAAAAILPELPKIGKEEYKDLVNTYGDSPSDLWQPDLQQNYGPRAPRLIVPPEQEDKPPYAARKILPPEDKEHAHYIQVFQELLARDKGKVSLAKLWDVYKRLRTPRLRYVADDNIRRAFQHFSWVESKSREGGLPRYMDLLEDCAGEGIPIKVEEWNTAISFAGQWVRQVTAFEVKAAVELWMRMEHNNAQANNVTFNILFDVAVKAGRFALADTIHNELNERGMPLNRYFRVSMIYYTGMRGDGDAVRQAFRDLVNAGEIVDTAVMNCVILSLVRAGEPAAAEQVFAKMKRLHEQKLGLDSVRPWQEQKELSRLLYKAGKRLRRERKLHESSFFGAQYSREEKREELQRSTPIAPNARTYRILIQHHAYTSGDLERIRELMDEMEEKEFNIHGSVYVHVFRGFQEHGGDSFTAWSRARLEEMWIRFIAASERSTLQSQDSDDEYAPEIEETERAPYITRGAAHALVRAFYRCAGRKRMVEVWKEIQDRWKDVDPEDRSSVEHSVQRMIQQDSIYIT
ncbi:hypothetical protein EJ03DRAFT_325789 [Teratosphaeria nubilosa]|uniref:Pentacotripeptide-repeat region of PRORP domain-containing protein n=1 Tax=Teratosphaeria nubilosa TaxID=161662 RepID=A0A6G1LG04_9PEZI|nr:hypothetical protein EJ03DRAFT_325789 [Teratosphaeria nubilosa]